ncbi:MAG TPA: DUF4124 domain-containing protein [Burkholderiales bacterium]
MQNRVQAGLVALAAGISFIALPAAGDTYKWTDADGKVHYSDQPPPASVKNPATVTPRKKTSKPAPTQAGDARPADAKPAPAAAKTSQELDAEFKQRQVEAAEKQAAQKKAAQEAADKQNNCAQAKAQVARLQDGGRISRYNDKGENEILDDGQIAAELARAKQVAESWCK